MKVSLYMAISANGMIAKSDDDTSWISSEEWNSYSKFVRRAGCMIIGRKTYQIITKQPEFSELRDVRIVVVSKNDFKTLESNHLVAKNPIEALSLLSDFPNIVVAGGGFLNSSFMEENLIDEIYLDIEPIVLGNGIPIFRNAKFETKLIFIDQSKISDNIIQLHYKVLKQNV